MGGLAPRQNPNEVRIMNQNSSYSAILFFVLLVAAMTALATLVNAVMQISAFA